MIRIRRAEEKDRNDIAGILREADEDTAEMSFNNFLVAEIGETLAGCVKLDDYSGFMFLSSLAVRPAHQGRGIAKKLMQSVLKETGKDIYIYTVIPDFFSKFGFVIAPPRDDLPEKNSMECSRCYPERCVCMVRAAQ